ncbi:leptin b [Genypterus blacodes]|uniref:leptin b n=1 Tax=Genypterus blacodes TaxID=154954 RepID=UPI003F776B73
MHHTPALFLLLASAGILAPGCAMKENSTRKAIQSIINIARIALVHIRTLKANLLSPAHTDVSSPCVEGVGSLSRDLGLLGNELLLLPFSDLLAQIQADVSSLEGRVRALALPMGCSLPVRPRVEAPDHTFPHSHLHLTLAKVQNYLEKIPPNKDKLKVC